MQLLPGEIPLHLGRVVHQGFLLASNGLFDGSKRILSWLQIERGRELASRGECRLLGLDGALLRRSAARVASKQVIMLSLPEEDLPRYPGNVLVGRVFQAGQNLRGRLGFA